MKKYFSNLTIKVSSFTEDNSVASNYEVTFSEGESRVLLIKRVDEFFHEIGLLEKNEEIELKSKDGTIWISTNS